jgi:hypothetical protein
MAAGGVRAGVWRHRLVVRALVRGTDAPSAVRISVRALPTHRSRLVATTTAAAYSLNAPQVGDGHGATVRAEADEMSEAVRAAPREGRRPRNTRLGTPLLCLNAPKRAPELEQGQRGVKDRDVKNPFVRGLFRSPLPDSNRRPPPSQALRSATGRNRSQRFPPV